MTQIVERSQSYGVGMMSMTIKHALQRVVEGPEHAGEQLQSTIQLLVCGLRLSCTHIMISRGEHQGTALKQLVRVAGLH